MDGQRLSNAPVLLLFRRFVRHREWPRCFRYEEKELHWFYPRWGREKQEGGRSLNVEVDRILEIACPITDGNLSKSIEGQDLVIHQSQVRLDGMGEWCLSHHAARGLTKKVLQSTVVEAETEKNTSQIWRASLPMCFSMSVASRLSALDGILKIRRKLPQKKISTEPQIRQSITELKLYNENIFKLSKHKRLCLKLLTSRPKLWLTARSFLTGPDESLEMFGIVGFMWG